MHQCNNKDQDKENNFLTSYKRSFVPRNGRVPDNRMCSRTPDNINNQYINKVYKIWQFPIHYFASTLKHFTPYLFIKNKNKRKSFGCLYAYFRLDQVKLGLEEPCRIARGSHRWLEEPTPPFVQIFFHYEKGRFHWSLNKIRESTEDYHKHKQEQ